jgi:hypothetical protein
MQSNDPHRHAAPVDQLTPPESTRPRLHNRDQRAAELDHAPTTRRVHATPARCGRKQRSTVPERHHPVHSPTRRVQLPPQLRRGTSEKVIGKNTARRQQTTPRHLFRHGHDIQPQTHHTPPRRDHYAPDTIGATSDTSPLAQHSCRIADTCVVGRQRWAAHHVNPSKGQRIVGRSGDGNLLLDTVGYVTTEHVRPSSPCPRGRRRGSGWRGATAVR